mmetsp:Transcript_19348/g.37381  ORF Transcript_19348/g.37381 Transcript_19348/m.37381 type:complete len:210 (-) Transcript_19348:1249-1878(-)
MHMSLFPARDFTVGSLSRTESIRRSFSAGRASISGGNTRSNGFPLTSSLRNDTKPLTPLGILMREFFVNNSTSSLPSPCTSSGKAQSLFSLRSRDLRLLRSANSSGRVIKKLFRRPKTSRFFRRFTSGGMLMRSLEWACSSFIDIRFPIWSGRLMSLFWKTKSLCSFGSFSRPSGRLVSMLRLRLSTSRLTRDSMLPPTSLSLFFDRSR